MLYINMCFIFQNILSYSVSTDISNVQCNVLDLNFN